jgi:hypothetical protein
MRYTRFDAGTVVRLATEAPTPFGAVAPAGSVGRVLRVSTPTEGDEPCYEVGVLLAASGRQRECRQADVEVVLSIRHGLLQRLDWLDLANESLKHPTLESDRRLVEVLRVCWSCGGTHALRYEVRQQLPSVPKEYDCPYCSARQEERASFADGVDVRLAVFPRSRPTRGS